MGALRRKLRRAGLSGLLVTHLPDVRYLCGFTGSSAALAVTRRSGAALHRRPLHNAGRGRSPRAEVEIVAGSPAIAAVQWLAAQPG